MERLVNQEGSEGAKCYWSSEWVSDAIKTRDAHTSKKVKNKTPRIYVANPLLIFIGRLPLKVVYV